MKRTERLLTAVDAPALVGPSRERSALTQPLSLSHSLRVKAAEFWLMLGEPAAALKELERLPLGAANRRWALKTRLAAVGALRRKTSLASHPQGA